MGAFGHNPLSDGKSLSRMLGDGKPSSSPGRASCRPTGKNQSIWEMRTIGGYLEWPKCASRLTSFRWLSNSMLHALDQWAVRVRVCPAYPLFPTKAPRTNGTRYSMRSKRDVGIQTRQELQRWLATTSRSARRQTWKHTSIDRRPKTELISTLAMMKVQLTLPSQQLRYTAAWIRVTRPSNFTSWNSDLENAIRERFTRKWASVPSPFN